MKDSFPEPPLVAMSNSINFGRASNMLVLAALNICSDGGSAAAMFVFSVSRVMRKVKWAVLIWSSPKFADPAGSEV